MPPPFLINPDDYDPETIRRRLREEIEASPGAKAAGTVLAREAQSAGLLDRLSGGWDAAMSGDADVRQGASVRRLERIAPEKFTDVQTPGEGVDTLGQRVGSMLTKPYEFVARGLGTRPDPVEPYALPRMEQTEDNRKYLEALYGPSWEYANEPVSDMFQTPDGQQRLKGWIEMMKRDPAYQDRRKELRERIPDDEARIIAAVQEYREERKKDAELNTTRLAANASFEAAATVLPALRTTQVARAAGIPLRQAVKAGITEEVMGLPMLADRLLKGGAKAVVRNPRVLGMPLAGAAAGAAMSDDPLEGAATGLLAGTGLAAGSGARSLWREATGRGPTMLDDVAEWARRTKDAAPGPNLTPDVVGWGPGKARPTLGNLGEAYGVTPDLPFPAGTAMAMGAMYGGMTGGDAESALIGGLTAGAVRRLAPRFPATVLGGTIGGLTGASVNEEDPFMGAAVGALGGVAGGQLLRRGLSPENVKRMVFVNPDDPNELRTVAAWMANTVPEAVLAKIPVFGELLFPVLREQDKLIDAARARMGQGVVDALGGRRAMNDQARMNRIYDIMETVGRGGRRIGGRLLPENAGTAFDPDDLEAATKLRKVMDSWFDDMVEAGVMKPEQYIEGYVPRMLDKAEFWRRAGKVIQRTEDARQLDIGMRRLFKSLDKQGVVNEYESARDFFIANPNKFIENLMDGGLGDTDALVKLLGGKKNVERLQAVVKISDEMTISPASAIHILRAGESGASRRSGLWGGQIKGDWIPEELRADFDLPRTGANIPIIRHLPTVIDRYIDRMTRRQYYDPLIRAWNSYEDVGSWVARGVKTPQPMRRGNMLGGASPGDDVIDVGRPLPVKPDGGPRGPALGGARFVQGPEDPKWRKVVPDDVVKGADGKPLRAFHGTAQIFDEFQVKGGAGAGGDLYGRGIYLTDSNEVANQYANLGRNVNGIPTLSRPLTQEEVAAVTKYIDKIGETVRLKEQVRSGDLSYAAAQMVEDAGFGDLLIKPRVAGNVRPNYIRGRILDVDDPSIDLADFKRWAQTSGAKVLPDEFRLIDEAIELHGPRGSYDDLQDYLGGQPSTDTINAYLQSKGFTGIEYQGGALSGGQLHRAFVVFDPKNVVSEFADDLYPPVEPRSFTMRFRDPAPAPPPGGALTPPPPPRGPRGRDYIGPDDGPMPGPIIDMQPGTPKGMPPKLQKLHDELVDGDMKNLSRIAKRLVNSRLGVPSDTDAFIQDAVFSLLRRDPESARRAARIILDLQYTGALGFNPAAAGRNLFQSMITRTALGPKYFAAGIREVAKREDYWTKLAQEHGALVDPIREAFDIAKISNKHPLGRAWNSYVEAAFSMFHAADRRNRLWAFTAAYRRAMLEYDDIVKQGRHHEALSALRSEDQIRFGRMAKEMSPEEFAGEFGTAISNLTQWVYGKRGSPLAVRNMVGANLGIFTTWPVNYISLMYEWAANGRIGPIVDMALGAAVLERIGEEVGVGRVTGFTADTEGVAQALPVGPIPTQFTPPGIKAIGEAGGLIKELGTAALQTRAPEVEPWQVRNLTMGARPAVRWWEAAQAADDDPRRSIRVLSGASKPQREK